MSYYDTLSKQGYYLVAEIGVNYYDIAEQKHITLLEAAKMMMREAKDAGIDAVKFQTYTAKGLAAKESPSYWDTNEVPLTSQYDLFKLYEKFGAREYRELSHYAQEIEAMAVFLRGYWHFEVVKVFGAAVPYVSLEDAQANTDPQVGNVDENGNYIYIWDKIAEDFKFAYENLPEYWDSSRQGCVNKWAAGAYLAKLYMYWSSPYNGTNGTGANKWADAKSLFETIMANGCDSKGQKYKLADAYNQLFEVF